MKWRMYLCSISEECQFKAPATELEMIAVKDIVKVELPVRLAQLYNETNGVYGDYGISFIWSTEQMVRENVLCRVAHQQSGDRYSLLFFSDAGNGDLFGYLTVNGKIESEDIYIWNHEDGSRRVVAASLKEFIKGWITGKLTV
ncbi:SMI1/KNR4 family protein [Rossellomorea vietnamensis]|uniref:SMI1/KNR4 family protein n=1 Tax=Rossellomorea vietnamensis TaxID=218284 RepID=UPI000553EF8F|nr:SMI1/KNR4 family protein [Rossellomorea vietnamensis]OXS59477.1 SMI1/KNR4 family protein [Bacillus sp. DSM 27956]PRX75967.1 SUKH superfamily protein [Bacillus sp. V-88]SLK23333.1 SMI1-KNR4 cell-wall [Bacillus sp. V-88]